MPRITRAEKARNRSNILGAADRSFRARGLDAVGVADVMTAAGLTHGGFYNHFASKEALAVEVLDAAFATSGAFFRARCAAAPPGGRLAALADAYLSPGHRDDEGGRCPSFALAVDASRHGTAVQEAYARGFTALAGIVREALLADGGPDAAPAGRATGIMSALVGGMVAATAVARADPALSDRLLAETRRSLPDAG